MTTAKVWRLLLGTILLGAALAVPLEAASGVELRRGDRSLVLTLDPDGAELRRLVLRSASGQRSLGPRSLWGAPSARRSLELSAEEGCAELLASFGPDRAGTTRTARVLNCPDDLTGEAGLRARLAVAPDATAKIGGPIEIRPLLNPALARRGKDLAVRLYFHGQAREGARVVALGPGGARVEAASDAMGIASLRIPASGPWTVYYRETSGAAAFEAALVFEVAPEEVWESFPDAPWSLPAQRQRPARKAATWRELGPAPIALFRHTGRAAAIVASPLRPPRYFAGGASGGVWESVTAGRTWIERNAGLPTLAIGALAVDPVDDDVLYAGSGEANYAYHSLYGLGLYKSTDGGRSWRVLAADTFAGRTFSRLVVSPFDPRVVWAAVGRAGGTLEGNEGAREHPRGAGPMGIFRSTDRGATWRHLRAGQGLPALIASDVDLDPVDRRRVYASFGDPFGRTRNGVYRSTDGGASFEPILLRSDDDPLFGRVSLAVAASDPDRLYALVSRPASREWPGGSAPGGSAPLAIFRSDDGGNRWTRLASPLESSAFSHYYSTILVHPEDPDTFFVGGLELMRSRDAGASYADVTPPHVDMHDMTFDALGRLLVADDGGVHRSDDLGATWKVLKNGGLGITQIYPGLSIDPSRPWIVLAGFQDNGTNLRDRSGEWFFVLGGDGGHTAIHPATPNVYFAEAQGTGNLYRSEDFGVTFEFSGDGIVSSDRHCFLPPVVYDPADPQRLLYATHRVYESTDGGRAWQPVSDDLTGGAPAAIQSLVIAPASSNVVYAATNDGRVLVSTNGGSVWSLILEGVGGWPRVLRQLAVDTVRSAEVYVADMRFGGERVLLSQDRGRTWRSIGTGLPNTPVNAVAVYRRDGQRVVFAGTDRGVFVTRNLGASWEEYGRIPRAPVMDLVVDVANGRLVASTLGRGAWEVDLP